MHTGLIRQMVHATTRAERRGCRRVLDASYPPGGDAPRQQAEATVSRYARVSELVERARHVRNGEHEELYLRSAESQLPETLDTVEAGQVDIQHRHVGRRVGDGGEGGLGSEITAGAIEPRGLADGRTRARHPVQ